MTTSFLNTAISAQTSFSVHNDMEIRRGFACVSFSQAGRRQIVEFLLPGDHIYAGDHEVNPGLRLVALSEVELMPLALTGASADQRAWRKSRSLAIARQSLINIGTRQALPRCAHLFCELLVRSHAAGLSQGLSFPLPLRQSDIADALGLTPVHVNRTLRHLRENGLLSWRRGVLRVHDLTQLQRCCDFDAGYLAMPGEDIWQRMEEMSPLARPESEAARRTFLPDKARPVLTLRSQADSKGAPGGQ
jgi:Crp-like helix-turn-helix protein